ncbi:sensor histidine kinase [Rhodococcus sp. AG1013]|uniref:sensor histidine kinase n=1 Tax=unclassified Rhodococcus (in: high G+C Gram-positive bacteria) TaxID=192944 RepID=UPI000E0BC71C|nr:sensor histidine kinase [Rhodococcus sp. AG1013]RDI25722.1 signal transduction histidine kinase [Rhodococcus sp. AG1013]
MARFPLSERWYRWSAAHAVGIDRVEAVLLTLVCLPNALIDGNAVSVAVTLGMTLPLAWRRSRTVISGFVVAAFAVAHLVLIPDTLLPSAFAVPVALYAFAAYTPRWSSYTALAIAILGAAAAGAEYFAYEGRGWEQAVITAMFLIVFVLAVWAFGDLRRVRIQELEGLAERARLLELERAQEAELAAVNERTRIAREMHDIVAHSLTVVIAQADGGRYGAAQDPQAAIDALETISSTGRQALTDMRALLSVLREDRPREFAAMPGAGDIGGLVAELQRGGLDVDLHVTGEPRELSTGTGLTAYRIVQESLTNVLKHAGPGAVARVEVNWGGDELELVVDDDGRGGAAALIDASPGGQGVIGMTERAKLHGGKLVAGPVPGGGYRVRGRLPYVAP